MYRVLISDNISEEGVKLLRREKDIKVDIKTGLSEEELIETLGDYHGLIVRSQTKVTRKVIESGVNLRVIGRAGVGVDNIDVEAATERGIVVVNAPEGNTVSAAEHTIAMLLSLLRKIPSANESLKRGEWDRKRFMGVEFRGKTLGIIGLGRIGSLVASKAMGLEMKVLAYDPFITKERARELGVPLTSLQEVIMKSDFLTVHTPLTKNTYHLIDEEKFSMMRRGVYIVNCARGGVIDEKALYEAIKSGKVAGAALDVFEEEPPRNSPLLELEEVVVTPHIAASTVEAQKSVGVIIAEEVISALKGLPVRNAVNLPSIKAEDYEFIRPFMFLGEKMGRLVASLVDSEINEVNVKYYGTLSGRDTEYVTRSVLKGIMEHILGSGINLVSAPMIAESRGIKIVESSTSETDNYTNLLEVVLRGKNVERKVLGTSFGKQDVRVIKIGDYNVDLIPKGHVIISLHEDRPGVIGRVGTLLGQNNINIARMHVGRIVDEPGGIAIMVLSIDNPPSEEVISSMEKLEGIINAIHIYFGG